jgi:hypothetical protein
MLFLFLWFSCPMNQRSPRPLHFITIVMCLDGWAFAVVDCPYASSLAWGYLLILPPPSPCTCYMWSAAPSGSCSHMWSPVCPLLYPITLPVCEIVKTFRWATALRCLPRMSNMTLEGKWMCYPAYKYKISPSIAFIYIYWTSLYNSQTSANDLFRYSKFC